MAPKPRGATEAAEEAIRREVEELSDAEVDKRLAARFHLSSVERLIAGVENGSVIPPYRNQKRRG